LKSSKLLVVKRQKKNSVGAVGVRWELVGAEKEKKLKTKVKKLENAVRVSERLIEKAK
jgi:hypothetical protein